MCELHHCKAASMGASRRALAVFSLMRLGPAMLPLSKILPHPHCDLSAASASFLLSVPSARNDFLTLAKTKP